MKICYGSYNRQVPVAKREMFAKIFSEKLAGSLREKKNMPVEIICCTSRDEVTQAALNGCEMIITECQLKLPDGGKPGDDNVGYGTVKEWTSMPGVKRVVLLIQQGDKPGVAEKNGRPAIVSGRKLIELFRRGYYDALYYNDYTVDQVAALAAAGRTEEQAKAYYGITDQMLELLLLSMKPAGKNEQPEEEKKSLLGGLFGVKKKDEAASREEAPQKDEKDLESASFESDVPVVSSNIKEAEEMPAEVLEKSAESVMAERERIVKDRVPDGSLMKNEIKDSGSFRKAETRSRSENDQTGGDVLKALLSGGTDSFFDDDKQQSEPAGEIKKDGMVTNGFNFTMPPLDPGGGGRPEFDFSEKGNGKIEVVGAEDKKMKEEKAIHGQKNENFGTMTSDASRDQNVISGESSSGTVSSCLNGGTLLAIEMANLPSDPDVARYSVTVLIKGAGQGCVINGRWESSLIVFVGYCVKIIMQRTLLVEVPDSDAPVADLKGKQCLLTFEKLS